MVFLYMHEVQSREKLLIRGVKSHSVRDLKPKPSLNASLPPIKSARNPIKPSSQRPQNFKAPIITIRGQAITKEQVIALKHMFDSVDRNGDGRWSLDEFKLRVPQAPVLRRLTDGMFRQFDADRSGSITFDELLVKCFRGISQSQLSKLLQWVREYEDQYFMKLSLPQVTRRHPPPSIRTLQEYQALFRLYDTNKDGSLSLEELRAGLKHMFPVSDIEKMFRKYDENQDNQISLEEFLKLMTPEDS